MQVSAEELAAHKAAMEEGFEKHRLKPGDPGYQHDKRVEFEATEANDWDDELEDFTSEARAPRALAPSPPLVIRTCARAMPARLGLPVLLPFTGSHRTRPTLSRICSMSCPDDV